MITEEMVDAAVAAMRRCTSAEVHESDVRSALEAAIALAPAPATDAELVAEMRRRGDALSPYNSTRLAYHQCANMLAQRSTRG